MLRISDLVLIRVILESGVIKLDTKKILKYLKLNESNISMVLGALVIVILGIIVINYFRNQPSSEIQTGTSTESQPTEQPTIKRGEGSVEYTVAKGETLWGIAEKQYGSGYNWVDIAKENKLANPNHVEADQKLTIPDVEPKTPTVKTSETSENSRSSTYTVKAGDSLWNISVRTYADGYQWTKIASANDLKNPDLIHSGNILTLPR
ncbi:LysM peptidoglycan-binding domain-containing protein [Candidatus Woesebacteria bacterium]|nr:LysM peptidoglycan-binding domain-containing protein [Candidatus Woesebacteria bacterium]